MLAYALASLWPFTWAPPRQVTNGVEAGPEQTGIRFSSPGLARTYEPPVWINEVRRTNVFDLRLRIRSFSPDQRGPARIFTLSRNTQERLLMLGQQREDLVLRFRTAGTSINGTIDDNDPFLVVPGVFRDPDWIDITVAIMPGSLVVRVNSGPEVGRELSSAPLSEWRGSHRMAIGNEVTGARPWLGEIEQVRIQTASETYTYEDLSLWQTPEKFWETTREPKLEPFRYLDWGDAINNLLLYIPLGFLFAILVPGHGRFRLLRPVLLVAAVSASMEIAQLFISTRNPSINDLILNTISGALGAVAARLTRLGFQIRARD
ncbi:MAG: VanZ family protein [Pseudomonadota bacterium]